MPFFTALSIGAGASALGGIGSALIGSNASQAAAKTEANAANQASQTELKMFNQAQGDLQPWMTGGQNGLAALQQMLNVGPGTSGGPSSPLLAMLGIGPGGATGGGINPATFQSSPGYEYQLQQGTNAVTNSAAANGGIGGNALKALQSTGQGMANQGWNQYLGQVNGGWNSLLNGVTNLSGSGQQAAGAMAGQAMSIGNQIGSNQIGAGNAMGAGTMGSANALSGGLNSALGGMSQSAMLYALMNGQMGGGMPSATAFSTAANSSPFMTSGGLMNYPQLGG